ncbi:transposase [Streptomyces sp. NPDC001667]
MVMKFYSPEFKADAVALCLSDPDLTLAGAAKDLGISRGTLRDWIRTHRGEHGTTTSTIKEPTAVSEPSREEELKAEIAALCTELKTVRKENATLAQERGIRPCGLGGGRRVGPWMSVL